MEVPVKLKVKPHKISAHEARRQRMEEIEEILDFLPIQRLNKVLWDAKIERNAQVLSHMPDFGRRKRHTPSKF